METLHGVAKVIVLLYTHTYQLSIKDSKNSLIVIMFVKTKSLIYKIISNVIHFYNQFLKSILVSVFK